MSCVWCYAVYAFDKIHAPHPADSSIIQQISGDCKGCKAILQLKTGEHMHQAQGTGPAPFLYWETPVKIVA